MMGREEGVVEGIEHSSDDASMDHGTKKIDGEVTAV